MSIALGGSLAKRSFDSWLPRILTSSSLTILMTCWEGERAVSTSSPMAFSLMFSMSCLTTRKLTSASSSATRISRRALSIFSALRRPSPFRFLKTRCSFSERLSNMLMPGEHDLLLGRRDPYAARRHLPGAVHAQLVQHACAGLEIGGRSLGQAGDMEEDVAA